MSWPRFPPAAHSRSWGIGDLADVGALARALRTLGAGVLGLSPLHAPQPVGIPADSPYYPSTRRWRSPLLLRVDDLPGAAEDQVVADLAARGRALLSHRRIDRAAVWALQQQALEHLWARRPVNDPAFDRWCQAQGPALHRWATFAALAEQHGPNWHLWPVELQHPESPSAARAAQQLDERLAFHCWVQHQIERQLAAARPEGVALLQDLAIGVDPAGGDAWALQDLLALDVRVGAPADPFAPVGQDWGIPPFVPWRLRDAGYRPLAELLRAAMTTGGLRIDHVMGLARLFWIPPDGEPADGTYVRFAGRELLEVVALESARTRALVVGEDLGTVEGGFRLELAASGILSTRLVWFEDGPPETYPEQAMAAVTTHDLPTIAGVWTGADAAELEEIGRASDVGLIEDLRDRLVDLAGLDPIRAAPSEVAAAVHARLANAPSAIVVATTEDLCAVTERPNIPGTTVERPNWSLALPLPIDDLLDQPLARAVLDSLAAR